SRRPAVLQAQTLLNPAVFGEVLFAGHGAQRGVGERAAEVVADSMCVADGGYAPVVVAQRRKVAEFSEQDDESDGCTSDESPENEGPKLHWGAKGAPRFGAVCGPIATWGAKGAPGFGAACGPIVTGGEAPIR